MKEAPGPGRGGAGRGLFRWPNGLRAIFSTSEDAKMPHNVWDRDVLV